MNLAIVHGHLSSPPRTTHLPSGDVLTALEVTVPAPTRPRPFRCRWRGSAHRRPSAAGRGHEVVVVGRVRRRWFRAGATSQSRTEVVAEVVPATPAGGGRKALAGAQAAIGARL